MNTPVRLFGLGSLPNNAVNLMQGQKVSLDLMRVLMYIMGYHSGDRPGPYSQPTSTPNGLGRVVFCAPTWRWVLSPALLASQSSSITICSCAAFSV